MDMHEKKLKKEKKKKEESGDALDRRPFDRDVDSKANAFDNAIKKEHVESICKD